MKTVRFSQVVERSGRPQVHALWVAPEHDAELKAAEKAQRVMTVSAPARGKADVGMVGYDARLARKGQLLIFPKSLARFAGSRVVGVKFDLVEQPATRAAKFAETLAATGRGPKKHPRRADTARSAPPAAPTGTVAHDKAPPRERTARPDRHRRDARAGQDRQFGAGTTRPPAQARRTKAPQNAAARATLKDAVRAALDELRAGKTVAAYQRLERALQ